MLWVGVVTVFLVALFAAHTLARVAPRLKLLAMPGEHRRHLRPTPMVGGIAIFLGLLAGCVLVDASFALLMPGLFLLCCVGALDDRYTLPSWSRFLAQGVAAYAMLNLTGVRLESLGYLVGVETEVLLGPWSTAMTIFAVIGVINAINMSDGMDGLAGGMVSMVLVTLLVVGGNETGLTVVALLSVFGFLFWNLRIGRDKAAIFMGDAGSTMLGLLVAYLLIEHAQSPGGIWPVTALWFLALPLIDAVAVLVVRPLRGQSPFAADRIHYHHMLLDRGFGVNYALLVALVTQLGFIVIGISLWRLEIADHLQLIAFLMVFVFYVLLLLGYTHVKR